jgi:hypothetical protein
LYFLKKKTQRQPPLPDTPALFFPVVLPPAGQTLGPELTVEGLAAYAQYLGGFAFVPF